MKKFAVLAASSALIWSGAAIAQEVAATEAAPEAASEAEAGFSDAEIASFVTAAMGIQSMDETLTDEAKQARSIEILEEAGIEPATFNAIGAAMGSDPEVAERIQAAAQELATQAAG